MTDQSGDKEDEHPNVALVRTLFDSLLSGDVATALGCYAEDGVYRVSGNNLVSGNYRGRAAILAHNIMLMELTGGTMHLTVKDVIGDDGHAVLFWNVTAERAGSDKTLDSNGIMAFKIDDQGTFSESWFLYNDQRAYDDFFS